MVCWTIEPFESPAKDIVVRVFDPNSLKRLNIVPPDHKTWFHLTENQKISYVMLLTSDSQISNRTRTVF